MSLSFFIALYYGFYFSALAVFVIYSPPAFEHLGFSPFEIGFLMSITPFVRFLSPFFFLKVQINDKIFKTGLLGSFICTLLAPFFISSFSLFCFLVLIFSIFWTVGLPYIDALAIEQIGKDRYGKVRLFGSIGFAICSIVIGWINSSEVVLWLLYVLFYFVAVVVGFYITTKYKFNETPNETPQKVDIFSHWQFWVSIFFFQLSFGAFYSFYSIYCLDHGFSKVDVSYLWAFGVFCEILMFWWQGRIVKKYSPWALFVFSTLLVIPRWLIVWLYPSSLFLAYVAQSFHAFNLALYMTATFAFLASKYQNLKQAKLYLYGFSYGLGGFLGSLIGGKIYGENIFAFSLLCAIIASIVLFIKNKTYKDVNAL